jgi:PKD repeat protein
MRSIRLMAVSTLILAGAWACGDGGGVEPNTPPVAAFTAPTCTPNVPCQFTDASTDGDGSISTRSWEFGDNTAAVPDQNPLHTFAAAGTFQVKLTVTDNNGATGTVTNAVTVGGGNNVLPTASFDLPTGCTAGTPCGFHSTSTDADGTIATSTWDFGDPGSGTDNTASGADATHTYSAAGTFPVTLTVTDNAGGQGTVTQQLNVSPAASQDCTTAGTVVDCSLGLSARVTVKITIVSQDCELAGDKLTVTPAGQAEQTAFFNLCNRNQGEFYDVKDGTGAAPLVFQPGSTLPLRFWQGPQGTNPPVSDPGIRITGSYPNWTLNIDDGGAAGTAGEPDFNDVVLLVQATPAP